jgi:hypothetical protein
MRLRRHFLLLLVVGMSVSTLARADSTPLSMASSRPATGVYDSSQDYSSHFSTNRGTPATLAGFHSPSRGTWSGQLGVPRIGKEMLFKNDLATYSTSLGERQGTINDKTGNWAVWHRVSPMAAPESGSLMVLSTGLICIAGIVRRQLRRETVRT